MVNLVKHDLQFILDQIIIAEKHASGTPLTELVESPLLPYGLRTVDGSYNNLVPGRETWGAADQPFLPLVTPSFRTVMVDPDGPGPSPAVPMSYVPGTDNPGPYGPGTVLDPSVRTISNLIADTYLMVALRWSAYAPDRPLREEMQHALSLMLDGIFQPAAPGDASKSRS